jgi:homoserine kinase
MSALRREAVRVVVPASSANLGPAFDCAGLALGVYDELVAMVTDDPGVLIEVAGEGAKDVPRDESHLVVRAMRAGFDWLGVDVPGFVLRTDNRIPHGRGLGSSAAAAIGGIVLARAMVDDGPDRMTDSDVLQVALAFESHPDNLAAALYGGLTVAWLEADGFADAVRMVPHPAVQPVVLVPSTQLLTSTARALLPETVAFSDATANVGRAALLVHALTVDPTRLVSATQDRLHQDCRARAYPHTAELVGKLRSAGLAAVVSGAGPSVLVLARADEVDHLPEVGQEWVSYVVGVATTGARELPLLTAP